MKKQGAVQGSFQSMLRYIESGAVGSMAPDLLSASIKKGVNRWKIF